jgi:hypothetical protein
MASISTTPFALRDTPKGVRIDLSIYYYPDGHANLIDGDDNNFPVEDDHAIYAHVHHILTEAKRHMRKRGMKVSD